MIILAPDAKIRSCVAAQRPSDGKAPGSCSWPTLTSAVVKNVWSGMSVNYPLHFLDVIKHTDICTVNRSL